MIRYAYYIFDSGVISIGYEENAVVSVHFCDGIQPEHIPSPVSDLAAMQLREYFDGSRQEFTFPRHIQGTPFQELVWKELHRIPYGETRTYGQIAAAIGKPKAVRAVGMACNKNPLWIAIPCHRVVGQNNALTGYAGGLERKQQLLHLERQHR